jgi:hypothetical protein
MAIHRHTSFGRLSERTMRAGSAAFGDATDRGRRGLHGLTIVRHHRKCVPPRTFTRLDLGWTGSHHHGRIRRIEDDLLGEISRGADPNYASVHIDCNRTIRGRRQISIGCQKQGKKHAADENKIFDDRHESPRLESGDRVDPSS